MNKTLSMLVLSTLVAVTLPQNIQTWNIIQPVQAAMPLSEGFADIVAPLTPAVVNIHSVKFNKKKKPLGTSPNDAFPFEQFNELFRQFNMPFPMEEMPHNQKATSLGSGFIIDASGYIVTNHHVIQDADEITIKLNDNTELIAKIIGSDEKTDLALLKVEAKEKLPYVSLGDSSKARLGDWVITIGNPFGLGGTVTTGIISSKARDIDISNDGIIDDYIQTDAAINSGSSGGPMFNLQGEVIGVNTAILSSSGTNIGIGFAIPSNIVKSIIEDLKLHGRVSRGKLGIHIQDVTPEIAEGLGLPTGTEGVLIGSVEPNNAGDKAGLKTGDVIIEYAGQPVKTLRKLKNMVATTPSNSETSIKLLREGKTITLKAKIIEDKLSLAGDKNNKGTANQNSESPILELNDVRFAKINKEIAEKYKLGADHSGIIVINNSAGNAWRVLNKGDVIIAAIAEVKQQPINDTASFEKYYKLVKAAGRKNIVLLIKRNTMTMFISLPVL